MVEVPSVNKTSDYISRLFNQTWLNRYPRSTQVRFDDGLGLKKDFIPLRKDFGVKPKPTSIKNPQSNAIVERVHTKSLVVCYIQIIEVSMILTR